MTTKERVTMGRLIDLIQAHMDGQGYRVSKRQVAERLGVAPSTIDNWREPKELIDKDLLVAIARLTGNPYAAVLNAVLEDIGYLYEDQIQVRSGKGKRRRTSASMAAERLRERDAARGESFDEFAARMRAIAETAGLTDQVQMIDEIQQRKVAASVKWAALERMFEDVETSPADAPSEPA